MAHLQDDGGEVESHEPLLYGDEEAARRIGDYSTFAPAPRHPPQSARLASDEVSSPMNRPVSRGGYYSDSAVEHHATPPRRRRMQGSRDPLAEGPELDIDSDTDGAHPAAPPTDFYGPSEVFSTSVPDYVTPHEDFIQPRKSRWTRKITRRRSSGGAGPAPQAVKKGRLAAYCICSELATEKIQAWLVEKRKQKHHHQHPSGPSEEGTLPGVVMSSAIRAIDAWWRPTAERLVGVGWTYKMYMGVVYYTNDDGRHHDLLEAKHAFFFPYGCAVFWGFTKEEEEVFIQMVEEFAVEPCSPEEREESYDDFLYCYGEKPRIFNYEITLTANDPEEKLALSFSLAQSAKLFVFEDRVDKTISSSKSIPVELATLGKITLSRKEISKLTGKVFLERNEINLHSDVLDTPEWFWEKDLHEPLYKKFSSYLDIPNRIEILNKRLDILRELLDVLNTQLENSHSTKLELIVIALILVEVVLQLVEMVVNDLLPWPGKSSL